MERRSSESGSGGVAGECVGSSGGLPPGFAAVPGLDVAVHASGANTMNGESVRQYLEAIKNGWLPPMSEGNVSVVKSSSDGALASMVEELKGLREVMAELNRKIDNLTAENEKLRQENRHLQKALTQREEMPTPTLKEKVTEPIKESTANVKQTYANVASKKRKKANNSRKVGMNGDDKKVNTVSSDSDDKNSNQTKKPKVVEKEVVEVVEKEMEGEEEASESDLEDMELERNFQLQKNKKRKVPPIIINDSSQTWTTIKRLM
ncbi:general transcriptional corepressor trfA-like [Parasteatoda tepidariorum]|uniref:general transcriptional corepressor trfA-like n=1 Tax=Parasteatoda tepidariorum TaxID=114398 RepID=UPI0039BC38D2